VAVFLSAWICCADVELAFGSSEQQICVQSTQLIVREFSPYNQWNSLFTEVWFPGLPSNVNGARLDDLTWGWSSAHLHRASYRLSRLLARILGVTRRPHPWDPEPGDLEAVHGCNGPPGLREWLRPSKQL